MLIYYYPAKGLKIMKNENFEYLPAFLRPLAPYFSARAEKKLNGISAEEIETYKADQANSADYSILIAKTNQALAEPFLILTTVHAAAVGAPASVQACFLALAAYNGIASIAYSANQVALSEIDKKQQTSAPKV